MTQRGWWRCLTAIIAAALASTLASPPAAFAWSPREAVPRLSDLPAGFQVTEQQDDGENVFIRFQRPSGDYFGPDQLDCLGNRFPSPQAAAAFINTLRQDGYHTVSLPRIGDESVAFLDVDAASGQEARIAIVTFRIGQTVGSVFASRRDGTVSIHQAAQVAERVASRMVLLPVPDFPIAFGPPTETAAPSMAVLGLASQLWRLPRESDGSEPALLLDEPSEPLGWLVLRANSQVWRLQPRGACDWCGGARGGVVWLRFGYVSSELIGSAGQRQEFWTLYQVP